MAKLVLLTEYLSIGGTDLSAYTRKCELTVEVEDKDVTTFGSAGWHERLGGLKNATLNIEFVTDFAAGLLDAIMWPLLGTVAAFEVRPTSAVVGTSNPKWTGNLLVTGWNPLTGSVGDEASVSVSYPATGAVTRGTS